MGHKRADIRTEIYNKLLDSTEAGELVYINRVRNIATTPAINIRDGDESPTPRDVRSSQYIRKFSVSIDVKTSATDDLSPLMDEILDQIESIILSDPKLSGKALGVIYTGTEEPNFDASGDTTIATTTISFEITYIS